MKVDRRSFLSFVIGGAAGTALSPLPWKLMDDSSIWSQMWPWTPVPPDGEVVYMDTTCSLCPGGCGISVRKVDNRAVKIEGKKGHPINDGGVCILGLSGLQMLYGPTRIKAPMKRIGERGEGKWQKISWGAAMEILSKKLGEIREHGEAHSVAAICGADQGTVPSLLKRFMTAYGSPNFICAPSFQDTDELAVKTLFGAAGRTGFDLENADYILSFGSGLADGWRSPVRMIKACSTWREKRVPVVQVEPRLSNSAAKANRWVPITPGTEADLALGIAAAWWPVIWPRAPRSAISKAPCWPTMRRKKSAKPPV
ncbi:molybdopterin-dependent oxidoreductase [Desulfosarcina cetonica]|uniref:molybdopterin-dependent oxidoreductase n=1 Tax=Desulfosarcina cetonica TaxID=90730 RepID=UPI0006D12AC4|nr:molybdopterin-dependent oxidoreductase [Desulfosarcina cetonica]